MRYADASAEEQDGLKQSYGDRRISVAFARDVAARRLFLNSQDGYLGNLPLTPPPRLPDYLATSPNPPPSDGTLF